MEPKTLEEVVEIAEGVGDWEVSQLKEEPLERQRSSRTYDQVKYDVWPFAISLHVVS